MATYPKTANQWWTIHKTRYPELGYAKLVGFWQIMDMMDDPAGSQVGPHYTTEKELLADLDRYAVTFGCNGTCPRCTREYAPPRSRLSLTHGYCKCLKENI